MRLAKCKCTMYYNNIRYKLVSNYTCILNEMVCLQFNLFCFSGYEPNIQSQHNVSYSRGHLLESKLIILVCFNYE